MPTNAGKLWKSMESYGNLWKSIDMETMEIYGKLWKTMEIYGKLWESMEIYGKLWILWKTRIYGNLWKSMENYGNLGSMEIYGNLWKTIYGIYGNLWKTMNPMESYGNLWKSVDMETMGIYGNRYMSPLPFVFFPARHPPKFDPMPSPHLAFCAKFYQKKREDPKSEMTKNGKSRRMIDNTVIQYKKNACCASCLPKFTRTSNEC